MAKEDNPKPFWVSVYFHRGELSNSGRVIQLSQGKLQTFHSDGFWLCSVIACTKLSASRPALFNRRLSAISVGFCHFVLNNVWNMFVQELRVTCQLLLNKHVIYSHPKTPEFKSTLMSKATAKPLPLRWITGENPRCVSMGFSWGPWLARQKSICGKGGFSSWQQLPWSQCINMTAPKIVG